MSQAYPISDPGMELRDLLSSEDFRARMRKPRNLNADMKAFSSLAQHFAGSGDMLLQALVNVALEITPADSAGISLEIQEDTNPRFQWVAVAGSFERFLHGTTPRFFSPCGECVDRGKPQLYTVSKPYYDFLGIEAEPITDGILIPWKTAEQQGTFWIVSQQGPEAFDFDDYSVLVSLTEFAAIAVEQQGKRRMQRRDDRMESAASTSHTMAHEINNPLQSLTNTVYLAKQGDANANLHLEQASRDLARLSEIVKTLLVPRKD